MTRDEVKNMIADMIAEWRLSPDTSNDIAEQILSFLDDIGYNAVPELMEGQP